MKNNNKQTVIETLKKQISDFDSHVSVEKAGQVIEVGDGIAKLTGLSEVMSSEMLDFGNGIFGVALNLEEDTVGAMILGDWEKVKQGDKVKSTGRILEVPVGEHLIGRVVDPLGKALDNKGKISSDKFYPVEKIAPGVLAREEVHEPVQTGIKAVDSMIPVGRGQRELIIGDRQTGKTAIAIDTIINQKDKDLICVYVAVGQKESKIAQIKERLEKEGAMDHTIIVLAGASKPSSLSYIAPFAGSAIAEYFMDQGKDVLVVYDDLSKHAVAYREISLLLRRPPGREAYPGDVFYLHSRLLERAAKLNKDCGGGSITALPIIETQAGDISAYIPTNVISITDGQIFLESDLFHQGVRPAVNVGLSVSRVGSKAQIKAMKKVAGKLRLDVAQYRELAAFAQFGSDLDEQTKAQIEKGKRIIEILKQNQYKPISVEKQVVIIYAAVNGILDNVKVEKVKEFEQGLYKYLEHSAKDLLMTIKEKDSFDEKLTNRIEKVLDEYKTTVEELLIKNDQE
ncbi:MAG TPA: F0F1 ATP synthase subunit alpha [Patescibacteria group bacterium]|nr:F0F1 ATP synthase subunit alpha [Patescibacteria group bacterium]